MTRLLKIFLLLVPLSYTVKAQLYPVQGSAVLLPPYSVYLTDYTSRTTDRLALMIALSDVTRPELHVRLRLRIQGQNVNIETKPEYLPEAIILQGGIPLRLSGSDLVDYFNPDNLNFSGMTRAEFAMTGALPQGFYQFCFEVLEYNRGVKISNTICAPGWLILNDPPIVNLPRNNEKIRPQLPQNVVFQWTPRHTGSPNAAFNTEYELKVVEVWPATRNPNDALLTSPPVLETTTRSTMFIYGPAETPLEPGRRYAYRIQAKSIVGAEAYNLFKNNGYSEVGTFVYGDACTIPENIESKAYPTRFNLNWAAAPAHTSYTVKYRQANQSEAEWQYYQSVLGEAQIGRLKPATTYEYQVQATCGVFESPMTTLTQITTPEQPEVGYTCGLPPETIPLDPSMLMPALQQGDVIKAGDFDVELVRVGGGNGTFSGYGHVVVPYLNKVKVKAEFVNIAVNQDLRMVDGHMDVTGAALDIIPNALTERMDRLGEMLELADDILNEVSEGLELTDAILDEVGTLANDILDNGPFTPEEEAQLDGLTVDQYLAKAQQATQSAVAALGNTVSVSSGSSAARSVAQAIALRSRAKRLNKIYEDSDTVKVIAVEFTGTTPYGFDKQEYSQHRLHYNILVTPDNKATGISWISMKSGELAKVTAQLISEAGIPAENIIFKADISPTVSRNGNAWTLTLPAMKEGETLHIKAIDQTTDEIVGKLDVVVYSPMVRKVNIVPVGNTPTTLTASAIEAELDRIYKQAVADWEVVMLPPLTVPNYTGILQDDEQALLSAYSDGMKDIIRAFEALGTMNEDEFYLFLVDNSQTGMAGYMPRKHRYGFIYQNQNLHLLQTIAHELGHGAFRLQHTFEEYPTITEATSNLMDYHFGTTLKKYQWDDIHNPPVVIGLLEDAEEGASSWTLIDKKHTRLFNHIFDNHNESDYTYLNKVNLLKDSGIDAFELNYEDSEYNDWVRSWKIRVIDFKTALNDELEIIKNTKKGDAISRVSIKQKHIYLGNFEYDGDMFPIAMYGNGSAQDMVNAFIKVEEEELSDLKNDENKKHIYVEETYTKYFIVALYEENRSEPSVIMQLEKVVWDNSLENWLRFLKILVEEEETKGHEDLNEEDAPKFELDLISSTAEDAADVLLGKFNQESVCNYGVRDAFYMLTGDSCLFPMEGSICYICDPDKTIKGETSNPGRANHICDDLNNDKYGKFELLPTVLDPNHPENKIPNFAKIQDLANKGYLVIGAKKKEGGSGHVVLTVPGDLVLYERGNITKDKYNVPVVLDCGYGDKFSKVAASEKWKNQVLNTKWYIYKP